MDDLKLYGKDKRKMDSLVNSVRIFSDDHDTYGVWVEEMWYTHLEERKSWEKWRHPTIPDDRKMKSVEEEDYKYLGLVFTTQLNSAFRAFWLFNSVVISRVLLPPLRWIIVKYWNMTISHMSTRREILQSYTSGDWRKYWHQNSMRRT